MTPSVSYIHLTLSQIPRGGDLGGRSPQNWRWGTAHALVPPIFREVVLSDAHERMNRVKMVLLRNSYMK